MQDTFIHSLSMNFATRLNRYVYREGIEFDKLVLGTEILLINIPKLILLFTISSFMGVFFPTLLTLIGFNAIRRSAFGLHASNNITCSITSVGLFVLVPFLLQNYVIHNGMVLAVFVCILLALYLYAPADTEARPILGSKNREKMKKKSMISGLVLLLVTLVVTGNDIKLPLTLGALYELVSILPITYKVLNRERNNYMEHENQRELISR